MSSQYELLGKDDEESLSELDSYLGQMNFPFQLEFNPKLKKYK